MKRFISVLAYILVIIGALNWGLWGFFQFDLVAWLFGGNTTGLSRLVYSIVGLAAVWSLGSCGRCCKALCCKDGNCPRCGKNCDKCNCDKSGTCPKCGKSYENCTCDKSGSGSCGCCGKGNCTCNCSKK